MADSPGFSFRILTNKTFPSFEAKSTEELLHKWGMQERINIQAFSYDNYFQVYQKDDFLLDFFRDTSVQEQFKVIIQPSKWVSLGEIGVKSVATEVISASITNMGFFDKLYQEGLVRKTGSICKCYDEQIDDILVSDEVRKMLLSDESDFDSVFTDEEKNEFIFQLFRHLCIGGPICQYEDDIKPYLDTTKFMYKDLISVHKDSSGKVAVGSIVLKVSAKDKNGQMIFPAESEHIQNFAYFVLNPVKRHLTTLYHSWDGFR